MRHLCHCRKKWNKTVQCRKKILRSAGFFVYILQCADSTFYTGYTKDLRVRFKLHNSGKGAKYVRSRLPALLVYAKRYCYYKHAVKEEIRIKSLNRVQKEKLVRNGRKQTARIRRRILR